MDDLISRQAAIKQILRRENHDMEHDFEFNQGIIASVNAIEELPTIDPVKYAMWEYVKPDDDKHDIFRCSYCGYRIHMHKACNRYPAHGVNYCPGCGANMGGEE